MKEQFSALTVAWVPAGTTTITPRQSLPDDVSLESPAIDVMTDLARVSAVSTSPNVGIDEALARMHNRGVHLLLVVNGQGETLGLVTARDINGNRAVSVIHALGIARSDVLVRDIMTPRYKMEAMWLRDVAAASVGDIIETLKTTGRQHAVVIEKTADGIRLRGIFSSMQIGRQLGVQIEQSGIASTFSDLEAALAQR